MMMMMMATFAVATAHAFVLTVSHGLLSANPPISPQRHRCRRFFPIHHIASGGRAPLEIFVSFSALESSPNSQAR
jgi:hypothetical protein